MESYLDDDEERGALEAEFKRLYAEQEALKASNDLEAWKRHLAALVDYQARVERRRALTPQRVALAGVKKRNDG